MKDLYQELVDYVPFCEEERVEKEVMLKYLKKEPDIFTRDSETAHFTTSAWIVNKNRDKVLMIHHNIYNTWAWIGGHADGDKNLYHVILKEIEEECGLTDVKLLYPKIYGLNIITVEHHIRKGKYVPSHVHFDIEFLFEADEKANVRIQEEENSGVDWIAFDEIDTKVEEEKLKPIYKRLIKKLEKIHI